MTIFFFQLFKYINMSLASLVSDEKLVVNLTEDLLSVTSYFSLAAFKSLSLSLLFKGLVIMCLSVALFEFTLCGVY